MAEDLRSEFRKQLPFGAIVALSRTAVLARDAVRQDMKRVFRHPTPYAMNAPRAVTATKETQSSAVILRDTGSVPAGNYLGPEIDAGQRRVKRFEMALRYKGILPAGMFVVPGKAAKLDSYGNMSEAQIQDVLGSLQAYTPGSALARRVIRANTRRVLGKRARAAVKYFVAKSNVTHQPIGVYKVESRGKVAPVMSFVRAPQYHQRLDFYGVVRTTAEASFGPQLDRALGELAQK